ncbi:MAG: hypothetical protein J5I91_08315 [Bacteroidetes bacterium]|nr:hypothetical protein [Bacteroidota bacterium]
MKLIINTIRVLVGLLFMFSGFVKFNDPIGFSYKMEEYFDVFSEDLDVQQDSLHIHITDQRGNEVIQNFAVYKNKTQSTLWLTSKTDKDLMEVGNDTFISTNIIISIDNEVVMDENYLYKPHNNETDSIYIEWALLENPKNNFTELISPYNDIENKITLDYSENLKPQPLVSKFFDSLVPYSLWIGMSICVFELVLGFIILIGWKPLPSLLVTLLMIIFFTFLTGYSAVFNKVTDCGCFGDAIKLTPWQSFYKDIILLLLILILLSKQKIIKPIFSSGFSYKSAIFLTILSFSYSLYALYFLPPINFLNFANGNNLLERTLVPEGQPKDDIMQIQYYYKNKNDGQTKEFDINNAPIDDENWEYVDRKEKIIQKAYKPKLDNFHDIIHPMLGDVSDSILNSKDYQLIIASYDITLANKKGINKAVELANNWSKETGLAVWFITSNSQDILDSFAATHHLDFKFCSADNKFVKSIIRSNPGVILLKGPIVIKNWDTHRIPPFKRIKKRIKY